MRSTVCDTCGTKAPFGALRPNPGWLYVQKSHGTHGESPTFYDKDFCSEKCASTFFESQSK